MTNALYKIGLLTCCLFLSVAMVVAQAVKTTISANRILIGEQIRLEIKISSASAAYQIGIKVPDSIPHFDIIDRQQSDTVDEKGGYILKQDILLTSFDSGVFVIPSFPITISTPNQPAKLLASDSARVSISYNPMLIGPAKDIKPIIDFGEKQGKLGYIIAGAITLILLLLLAFWHLKNRTKKPQHLSSAALSPYEEAMSSLQQLSPPLHQELEPLKIWYMALTDVLKKYYSRKTNRNMMGHTTSQFLGRMKAEYGSNPQLVSAAAKALDCADAVKFAKYIPTPDELAESVLLIKHTIDSLEKKPLKQP